MQRYVESGGHVKNIPNGISGKFDNNPFRSNPDIEPKSERTPLTDVVKTLEERKQKKAHATTKTEAKKRPKKRLIVDDFGDPVRWVWDE